MYDLIITGRYLSPIHVESANYRREQCLDRLLINMQRIPRNRLVIRKTEGVARGKHFVAAPPARRQISRHNFSAQSLTTAPKYLAGISRWNTIERCTDKRGESAHRMQEDLMREQKTRLRRSARRTRRPRTSRDTPINALGNSAVRFIR